MWIFQRHPLEQVSIFWHCLLISFRWVKEFIFQCCSLSCTETHTGFFAVSSEMPCSIMLECKVSQDSKNIPKGKHQCSDPWLPLKTARSSSLLEGWIAFILYNDKTSTACKTNMGSSFFCTPSCDAVCFPASFSNNLPSVCSIMLLGCAEAVTGVLILMFLCLS